MRNLYGYDHTGACVRWCVCWSRRSAEMVASRWAKQGLTVVEEA